MTVGISYTRTFPFAERTKAIGEQVRNELDGVSSAFTLTDDILTRAIRLPSGFDGTLPTAVEDRANQVIGFDAAGNLQLQPGVGRYRGDWATATDYKIRDVFKDAAGTIGLNNLYIVATAHTSTTLAGDAANYTLLVGVAEVEAAKVAAAASASAAATSETNAANSASAASTSETNAASSETASASSASAAATSETNAGTSATNAASSETAAGNSKTYAQEWANKAEDLLVSVAAGGDGVDDYSSMHQAKKAQASAAAASTSETNAATSETNAAGSASSASTSATNAATSETNAANSAAAAGTSETNAASSASAASTSETNAAASLYDFKGRWLGGQASDPALDLNGDALNAGDAYFDTTINKLKTYNGSAWQVAPATALDVSIDNTGLNTSATTVQDAVEAALIGRKNYLINGDFDIWQRGASQTFSGYGSDDRWINASNTSTKTHSQQAFTVGQTDVPGEPEFYSRTVVTSVAGAGSFVLKVQRIEGVRSLSGQTATFSFYAKADATKNIAIEFLQDFGTGGTPSAAVSAIDAQLVALTTTFTKYEITVDIPSIAGKTLGTNGDDYLLLAFWFDAGSDFNARASSLGQQSGTFDIARVQLGKGSVATDFEYRPIGEELALCKRYFQIQKGRSVIGQATGTTGFRAIYSFPEMRVAPSTSLLNPTGFDVRQGASGFSSTSSVISSQIVQKMCFDIEVNGYSGLTIGGAVTSNDSLDFLSLDSEL